MRRGVLFGREVNMAGSPLTLLIFREEFDESLPAYITEIYKHQPLDTEEFLRVAWAMNKTYDKDILDYEQWLDEFPDEAFSLLKGGECISVIDSAIAAELFREKPSIKERIKGHFKRFIRGLKGFFGR